MGYKDAVIEKTVGPLQADIYIPSLDFVIEINGPSHYKNLSSVEIAKSIYSRVIYQKYHKNFMVIPY